MEDGDGGSASAKFAGAVTSTPATGAKTIAKPGRLFEHEVRVSTGFYCLRAAVWLSATRT